MARIEIYDDWGKLAETIEIVSADAKDLRRDIELMLEDDHYECSGCGKFGDMAVMNLDNDLDARCAACDAANRKDS